MPVYKNTIKNFTANPKMRITYAVGIGFDDRIAEAQEIARKRCFAFPSSSSGECSPMIEERMLARFSRGASASLRGSLWEQGNYF